MPTAVRTPDNEPVLAQLLTRADGEKMDVLGGTSEEVDAGDDAPDPEYLCGSKYLGRGRGRGGEDACGEEVEGLWRGAGC